MRRAMPLPRTTPTALTTLAAVLTGAATLPMRAAPTGFPLDIPRSGSDVGALRTQSRLPVEGQPELATALANLKAMSAQRHAEEETVRREQHALEEAQAEVTRQAQKTLAAEAKEQQRERHEQLRRLDLERQEAALRVEAFREPRHNDVHLMASEKPAVQRRPHRAPVSHSEADVSSLMQSTVVAKPRRSGPHASWASMLAVGIGASSSRVGLAGLWIGLLILAAGAMLGVLLIFAWPERQDTKVQRSRFSNDSRLPELRTNDISDVLHDLKTPSSAKLTPYLQEAMQPLTNEGAGADRQVRFTSVNSPGSEDSELVHFSAHGQERLTFESAVY